MSYRNLIVKNLAKSLQGRCYTAPEHVRTRSAYMLYQRPSRAGSAPRADKTDEPSLSETEAMLHQSLQRCRNIYGLIENSTRDFENEVKLIERIFNKYNDLAAKRGHPVEEEVIRKVAPPRRSSVPAAMERDAEEKGEGVGEEDVRSEEDVWHDLHQHTARCLIVDEEEPLYKTFVHAMEKKPTPLPKTEEKYPDPDAIDLFAPQPPLQDTPQWQPSLDMACNSATKRSKPLSTIGSRRLSTGKPITDTTSSVETVRFKVSPRSRPRTVVTHAPALAQPSAATPKPVPITPVPTPRKPHPKKATMSVLKFLLTSEMHRDNVGARRPKSDVCVSLPKRACDLPNKTEQLYRARYAKIAPEKREEHELRSEEEAGHVRAHLAARYAKQETPSAGMARAANSKSSIFDTKSVCQQTYAPISTSTVRMSGDDDKCSGKKPPKKEPCKKEPRCPVKEKPKCENACEPEPCKIEGDTPKKASDCVQTTGMECQKGKKGKGGNCLDPCRERPEPVKKKEEECCIEDWEYPDPPDEGPCGPKRKEPKRYERDKNRCNKGKCDTKGREDSPQFDAIGLKTCAARENTCGSSETVKQCSKSDSIFGRLCSQKPPPEDKCKAKCAKPPPKTEQVRELSPQEVHIERITKSCRERMQLAAAKAAKAPKKADAPACADVPRPPCPPPEELAANQYKPTKGKGSCDAKAGCGDVKLPPLPPLPPAGERAPGVPVASESRCEPKAVCPKVDEKPRPMRSYACKPTAPVCEGESAAGCKPKRVKAECEAASLPPEPKNSVCVKREPKCPPTAASTAAPPAATPTSDETSNSSKKAYSTFSTPCVVAPLIKKYESLSKTDVVLSENVAMMRQNKVTRNPMRTFQFHTARAITHNAYDGDANNNRVHASEYENPARSNQLRATSDFPKYYD